MIVQDSSRFTFFPGTSKRERERERVSLEKDNKLPKRPALNCIMKIHILLMKNVPTAEIALSLLFSMKLERENSSSTRERRHRFKADAKKDNEEMCVVFGGRQRSIRSCLMQSVKRFISSQTSFFSPTMIACTCLFVLSTGKLLKPLGGRRRCFNFCETCFYTQKSPAD